MTTDEIIAVGMEPVVRVTPSMLGVFPVWFDGDWHKAVYKHGGEYGTGIPLHTAEQLAAARLQGAEEERKKQFNNSTLVQIVAAQNARITDLERVNQGLLDDAARYRHCFSDGDFAVCRHEPDTQWEDGGWVWIAKDEADQWIDAEIAAAQPDEPWLNHRGEWVTDSRQRVGASTKEAAIAAAAEAHTGEKT